MNYRGLLIELSDRRGRWRVRVTKPRGFVRYQDEGYDSWISTPYMQRDLALADAKALIDEGDLQ